MYTVVDVYFINRKNAHALFLSINSARMVYSNLFIYSPYDRQSGVELV